MDLKETVLEVADLDGISPARLVGIAVAVAVSSVFYCIKCSNCLTETGSRIWSVDNSLQPLPQPLGQIPRSQPGSMHQHPQSILDLNRTKSVQAKRAPRQVRRRRHNQPNSPSLPQRPSLERHLWPSQVRRRVLPQRPQLRHRRTKRPQPTQCQRNRPRARKTTPLPRLLRARPARPGEPHHVLRRPTSGATERRNTREQRHSRHDPLVQLYHLRHHRGSRLRRAVRLSLREPVSPVGEYGL